MAVRVMMMMAMLAMAMLALLAIAFWPGPRDIVALQQ